MKKMLCRTFLGICLLSIMSLVGCKSQDKQEETANRLKVYFYSADY